MAVVISRENVKPSSPTPLHLHTYKLSMLDQLAASMLVPVTLYFPYPQNFLSESHAMETLKRSLSLILTRFYPIAGRVGQDCLSIDCNDQGVPFYVAKFIGQLSDFLKNPDLQCTKRLLPCDVSLDLELGPGGNLVMIQVNHFECGGIVIGAVFWHKVVDAMTIGTLLKAWAGTTKEISRESVCPNYISPLLFPQKEEMKNQGESLGSLFKRGKTIMHRYVFDASAIQNLKDKSNMEYFLSRVEVVSAFLWKCFMVASLSNGKHVSLLTQAVNLRRRAKPSYSSDCFGNFPGLAVASSTNENEKELGHLVMKMRNALNTIDHDYVNRMLGDEGFLGYIENQKRTWSEIEKGADLLCISSWCGFGLYDIDFGWGKPTWVTRGDTANDSDESAFLNMVWLMDTRHGDGVEAWVTLDESYMKVFENVQDLNKYASKDPSPFN